MEFEFFLSPTGTDAKFDPSKATFLRLMTSTGEFLDQAYRSNEQLAVPIFAISIFFFGATGHL